MKSFAPDVFTYSTGETGYCRTDPSLRNVGKGLEVVAVEVLNFYCSCDYYICIYIYIHIVACFPCAGTVEARSIETAMQQ
jgi:hypothetical protein